jgi:hypothetical protein
MKNKHINQAHPATFSLDEKTLELLDNYARSMHISKSAALRILILRYCAEQSELK